MRTRSNANVEETTVSKPSVFSKTSSCKKITSQIETKRRGLRSTGLIADNDLIQKIVKKDKSTKIKKKIITKEDSSSVDSYAIVKSSFKKITAPLVKVKTTNKIIGKKFESKKKNLTVGRVTRSKTNTPPVTRSPTPTPEANVVVVTRRPTRKTKEAATLYMEILGRKLISPDIENDDNLSVDSFPELPNARKLAQTENEMKAKMKKANVANQSTVVKEKKATSNSR